MGDKILHAMAAQRVRLHVIAPLRTSEVAERNSSDLLLLVPTSRPWWYPWCVRMGSVKLYPGTVVSDLLIWAAGAVGVTDAGLRWSKAVELGRADGGDEERCGERLKGVTRAFCRLGWSGGWAGEKPECELSVGRACLRAGLLAGLRDRCPNHAAVAGALTQRLYACLTRAGIPQHNSVDAMPVLISPCNHYGSSLFRGAS